MAANPNRPTLQRLAELAAQGLTDRQIGEMHGVSHRTIQNMRFRHRIPTAVDYPRQRGSYEPVAVIVASEESWAAALAGQRYTDQPVQPAGILRTLPPPTRHNGSSMAYA